MRKRPRVNLWTIFCLDKGKKPPEIKTNMNQNLFQLKQGLLLEAKRSVFFYYYNYYYDNYFFLG